MALKTNVISTKYTNKCNYTRLEEKIEMYLHKKIECSIMCIQKKNKYKTNSFWQLKKNRVGYFKLFADVCLHQLGTARTGTTHKD